MTDMTAANREFDEAWAKADKTQKAAVEALNSALDAQRDVQLALANLRWLEGKRTEARQCRDEASRLCNRMLGTREAVSKFLFPGTLSRFFRG